MDNKHVNTTWWRYRAPWKSSILVSHLSAMILLPKYKTSSCYLNIHYELLIACNRGWTPFITVRDSPLDFTFWLDAEKQPIHLAPSPRVALDQDTLKEITLPLYHSPRGDAGRIIPAILVERSRERFDGAYKAHCVDSRESTQFIPARADMSLLGLFCFYWGKKRQQIFSVLSHNKNRHSLSLTGVRSRLHFAWATCPSIFALRLNALRVAERTFTRQVIPYD